MSGKRYERELKFSDFKIEGDFSIPVPTLRISFHIRNISSGKVYAVLPALCKVKANYLLVGEVIMYPHPGGWFVGDVKEKNLGVTSSGEIMGGETLNFNGILMLKPYVLGHINEHLEEHKNINFGLEILLPAMRLEVKENGTAFSGMVLNKFETFYRIDRDTWFDWLRSWGYSTTLIHVPTEIAAKLRELTKKAGYLKEWEVISAALRQFNLEGQKVTLLRGNVRNPLLKKVIQDLLERAKNRIYIAVQIIDTELLDKIIEAVKRGIDVRIIIAEPRREWISRPKDARGVALRELSNYVRIRTKSDLHMRMLIIDDEVLVGSMDLDRQGLTVHDNIAVYTDSPEILHKALEEFDNISREAREFRPTT